MLSYNANRLIEIVKLYQSVSSMKAQLEYFQADSSEYVTNISSAINSLQVVIDELETKISGFAP